MSTRTALVAGGAGGIGFATAVALRGQGLRVVLVGRNEEALTAATTRLADEGNPIAGLERDSGRHWVDHLVCDLSDADAAAAAVHEVALRHGSLDVVVISAGGPPPGRVLAVHEDQWRTAFELMLVGPLAVARVALPAMAQRGFGRFVFVTSTAVRQPQPELATSTVLRAAVTSAAKLLSLEHAANGVTVNCVAPGATMTARRLEILRSRAAADGHDEDTAAAQDNVAIPAARPAYPEEIAAAVAFLASEGASYVNGTVLTVDGGRTATV